MLGIQLHQFHHHLGLRLREHHSRLIQEKLVHHLLRHHHRLLLYSHLAKQKILLHQHHPHLQVKYYLQLHRLHHRHHHHHQCYQVQFLLDYLEVGLREEYAYLKKSLERFPVGSEQERLARQAGFARANHRSLVAGQMGVLILKA